MQTERRVLRGQVIAERLMIDSCTITRTLTRVLNESTGVYADTVTTLYTGKCRVKFPRTHDQSVDAGARPASEREYIISIPAASLIAQVDDIVTITASGLDAAQVGVVMRVLGTTHGSQITARRMRCQEVTA